MTQYLELDWESSWAPIYGKAITIPENTILWRSYDTSYPAIGERFAYYSSKRIATEYKKNSTRILGHFVTTRPIKLMDYRFMRVLLSRLISTNSHDTAIQELAAIMMSFGLCSLGHQIEMVKMRYRDLHKTSDEYKQIEESLQAMEQYYKPGNIIEQTGVRIAETTNDTYTMGFLQELFKDVLDGFISPRMYSPFHTEKYRSMMSPEMILFNPKASKIQELIQYPKTTTMREFEINDIIQRTSDYVVIDNITKRGVDLKLDFFMCGGNQMGAHYLDRADDMLHTNDKNLLKIYNSGKKVGNKWTKKMIVERIEAPKPCAPVSPFINIEI
jgi:hypothetical protein